MTASRPTSIDSQTSDAASSPLHRDLGVTSIVFMVVAAAAPLAVVAATTPIIVSASGSVAVPSFFVLAAMILLLFTVGFTLMSRHVKNPGAFYSYVQAGLGSVHGLGAATLAIFSYAGLLLATSSYIGVAARNALSRYVDVDAPWWAYSIVVLIVVCLLGYRDIELSSKVLGIVLLLETCVVLVVDVAILVQGGAHGIGAESVSPARLMEGQPGLGLMFAFFAFFGFEATAVFRSEAKDPDRTIPRATYVSVIFIGLFYAVSGFAVIVGTGTSDAVAKAGADPENMVLDLAHTYVGSAMFDVIQVLLVTSLFACILSFHNVVTRYLYALGKVGVLPQRFGVVSIKYGAPSSASLAVSIGSGLAMAVIVLSGIDPVTESYTWLSGAATLGLVGLMTLASVAVIVFFRTNDHDKRLWHTVIAPVLAVIGLGAVLSLVAANFTVLISDPVSAWVVAILVISSYLVGVVVALRMRRVDPAAYAALTTD
ncbi:APC family permease [Rhodococcus jostii]|uniref:APC family permease n=1 Tax=Rhodococcus jostii TaxID=132919 RepID=A0ABU4CTS1_RHOJO|nr:APC family permease [Rhodococcus jostii]MDV6286976.1 APC family permease [Rhodococcus jostii]